MIGVQVSKAGLTFSRIYAMIKRMNITGISSQGPVVLSLTRGEIPTVINRSLVSGQEPGKSEGTEKPLFLSRLRQ